MSGCSLRDGVAPHRHRTTWLVLGAVLLVLVACSTRSGDGPGTPSGLTIWQLWHPDLIAPIVDRFVFEHPGIRVRVEQIDWAEAPARLAAALAAGEAPDLCELSSTWVPRFTAGGHLADLTRAASPMAAPAPAWDAVTVGGRVRALPWLASSRLLAVHRGLLDDAGPMPGSSPETWDDLLAAAGRIDSLDASIHGFGIPADAPHLLHRLLLTFAAGNGGRVLSADGQHAVVDSLPVVDALELLVGLSAHALRAPLAELELALAEGRLGMLIVDAAS
ncbi:MAG: extracellular solute-binding protein, partial [Candidatus Eiseniibacteriota bacterium]